MASNFEFLRTSFPDLFIHASHAESLVYSAPRASCFYARFTDLHNEGLDGIFDNDDADRIVSIVRSFNQTVEDEFGAA